MLAYFDNLQIYGIKTWASSKIFAKVYNICKD